MNQEHADIFEKDIESFDDITNQFENIITSLTSFKSNFTHMQQQLRNLEKTVKKEIKFLKKEVNKNKNKNKGNKKPSGFATPTNVTNELCQFMNKENGSKIARTEVTKSLIEYIKTNKLENNENSQVIIPDKKLQTLLGINEYEKLTYFNLQKFMNKHFIKNSDIIKEF
jgi:chromatin remodeling complex protein RSC6